MTEIQDIELVCKSLFHNNDNKKVGKGVLTMKTVKTEVEYTYFIKTSEYEEKVYTNVWVEVCYMNFKHIGVFKNNSIYKNNKLVKSNSAQLIGFVLSNTLKNKFDNIKRNVKIYHLGTCNMCNRKLTDSLSIELGLGPVCRKKV